MLGLFSSIAWGQAAAATAPRPTLIESLFPLIMIVGFIYVFMIVPQKRKLKEHQAFLSSLKRGDQVVTTGGLFGEITGVTDKFVTLQIADNVRVKVVRSQVLSSATKEGNP